MDRLLSEVSPEQFDEWIVFDRIEGDALERTRIILKYGLAAISQQMPVNPDDLDPIKAEKLEPANMSPQQAIAALATAYGV